MHRNENKQPSSATATIDDENVVTRLRRRIREAKAMGFKVRSEWLDDEQATWCEVGGVKTLFVDLSQTAAEQLRQLDETLEAFQGLNT